MLSKYYSSRLNVDVLHFEDLRAEDPTVMAPEYVDLLPPLAELEESDRWWENVPPSVSLKEPSLPLQAPHTSDMSMPDTPDMPNATERTKTKLMLKLRLPAPTGEAGRKSKRIPEVVVSRKKRPAEEDGPPQRDKRLKRASRRTIISDDDEDVPSPGPSKCSSLKGKARVVSPDPVEASEELEGSKVSPSFLSSLFELAVDCDLSSASTSNKKHACTMCVSQKTRCYIAGVFSIWHPRGKVAMSQHGSLQDLITKQQQEILEVKEQMKKLAKKLVVQEQEKAQLLSSVSTLQATVAQLTLSKSST
ncbi:hypothetical protein JVT61DRAFT_13718 [Boletus reticuloceps]|uniref:Uncharacterized protein n=1 Tax=Boletus reticuloceps TaxID=495285 RepID=A0A8I3AAI3_9AGAM|nr:hypothetical protein JVT61DRAFT_13718 [Boletus reticuloceps]